MTKKPGTRKERKIDWDAVCERTRKRCNKLSGEARRRLRAEAFHLI